MNRKKYIIVIAGPTAVGKTAVSIKLAQHFHTAILSSDSRQCFKEIPIGTAQPTLLEQQNIPHYFIASHSIHDDMNVGKYEVYALNALEKLFQQHDYIIVCGGTGLYIDALCNGIDEMPPIDKNITAALQATLETNGMAWLQKVCQQEDPIFWETAEQQNPARLIRAIAFIRSTGQSITLFKTKQKKTRPFEIIKIAIDLPREILYNRINQRMDLMLHAGLMEEVAQCYPWRHLKSLATVGYSEFYIYNHWPLTNQEQADATEKVKQHSRNYAKRQLTWFRKDKDYQWFSPTDHEAILSYIEQTITTRAKV